ncbi:MAG: GNAT family N-acetyltransferase [Bacteroidetes bacterium]|nr:GNAT family N-acetyltransferase [Bacteroidota bacterium]
MNLCVIITERLYLRRWIESDTQQFIEMNNDPEVMQYFPNKLTDTESLDLLKRINNSFDCNGFGLFAVEKKETNEFIGFTGFAIPKFKMFFTPCVEIGWRYKRKSWGQGFATEAAKACLRYGFETLNFDKIVSFTSATNKKSEQVMQRIGMKYVTDFNHPEIDQTNRLCRHVLYEIAK